MFNIATPARALAAELVAFTDVTSAADAYVHPLLGGSPEADRLAAAHTDAGEALAQAARILRTARTELTAAVDAYPHLPRTATVAPY